MKHVSRIATCVWAIGLMFLFTSAGEVAAGTLYVATNGSDANNGLSLTSPFATPGHALDMAQANDIIYLRSGRYTITRTLSVTKPGLTIATYSGDTTKAAIVAGTKINGPQSVIAVSASGVKIKNLEIQGGAYYGIKLDDVNGAQTGQEIVGNYIHHTGRDGIKAQRADGVLIENNEIGPTGVRDASNAEGIDMIGSIRATIRGNYIHDITTNGLYVKGGTTDAVVEKNLVINTGFAGILLGSETDAEFIRNFNGNYGDSNGSNDGGYEALNSIARNNIVVNTAMAGLGTIAGHAVTFVNNTLVNVARTNQGAFRAATNQHGTAPDAIVFKNNVVILDPASSRPLVYLFRSCAITSDHNIWFSDGGPSQVVLDSTPCANGTYAFNAWPQKGESDTLSAMDLRLDATDLYRPLAGSPVINAGEDLSPLVLDDYLGKQRPVDDPNDAYDVGAHEGVATTPVLLAAPIDLDASALTATRVELKWTDGNPGDSQTGFRVERSTDGGKTFAVIGTTATETTQFEDFNVTRNATYYYRVAAYNDSGISPYSNIDSVKTPRR